MKNVLVAFVCIFCLLNGEAQSTDNKETTIDTLLFTKKSSRYFEAEYDTINKLSFKEVRKMSDRSKTISIKLSFTDGAGTMLEIFNPFPRQLIYKAELYSYSKKDFVETSTIPVEAKLLSFENWPYKIDRLRLSGFMLIKAD